MDWPNGTSLVGYLESAANGGVNLTFGPDRQWAIVYIVPEGDENFPPGPFRGFEEATITYSEPDGFAAVIRGRVADDAPVERWQRLIRPDGTGIWMSEHGTNALWQDFHHDTTVIESEGF